jgi:hypothetical protein
MTAIIAMKAKQTHQDEVAMFDIDAKAIRIDNCESYCISNDKRDFITPLKKVNKKLKVLRNRAWIGAKLRRHQRSRLILTLLKALTPQPSLRTKKTLQSGTIQQLNFFVGITS